MVEVLGLMDHPAAPLLAADLGHLQHTNARGEVGYVHVPGFVSTAGMAEGQADEAGLLALAIAQAAIETLERKHQYRVIHESDLKAKVKAAAEAKPTEELVLHCNRCLQPVLGIDVKDRTKVDVSTLALALTGHAEVCR